MLPPAYAVRVASPLVVVLVMVACASAFATWRAPSESSQASPGVARAMVRSVESGPPGAASMPATPEYSGSDGPFSNDDADNEEDGTGYAFVVIAIVTVWVLLLGGGGLMLALRGGPAKPSSIYFSAPERPG
jgi:flagellar basal body-associated protein FliL